MANRLITSVKIDFLRPDAAEGTGSEGGGQLALQLSDKDNGGKTSKFIPGQQIKLRLFGTPSSLLVARQLLAQATLGTVEFGRIKTAVFSSAEGADGEAEEVVFQEGEGNLGHTVESFSVEEWYGESLGNPTLVGGPGVGNTLSVSDAEDNNYGMGVARIAYTCKYLEVFYNSIAGSYVPALVWVMKV